MRAGRIRHGYILVGHATRLPGKFFLSWKGERVVDRAVDSIRRSGLHPTVVSVLPPERFPEVEVLADTYDRGPMGGVRTIVEQNASPFVLIGGDMPQVDPRALEALLERHRPGVSIVPVRPDGSLEVLHAAYDLPVELVRRSWEAGLGLAEVVRSLEERGSAETVRTAILGEATFTDIDTAEDWERLQRSTV